jgi:Ca2+/H+ antiporter, TMEM165/GDT1 family
MLPTAAIQVLAGLMFLAFAAWTLRGETHAETAEMATGRSHGIALLTVTGAFVVAELGDKTMLATLTLAATNDALGTWLGASAGMISANVVAIVVGAVLGARLPQRPIRFVAAAAFAVFGLLLLAEGLGLL